MCENTSERVLDYLLKYYMESGEWYVTLRLSLTLKKLSSAGILVYELIKVLI